MMKGNLMKIQRYIAIAALALLGITAGGALAAAQDASDKTAKAAKEQKLLAVLGSNAPLFDKARACQQLAVVGGKKAVPALAKLLGDKTLGDYARFALEPIDDPSVDAALREAMGKLKGRGLAGVVNSIGVRRDAKAVGGLKKLVGDPAKGASPQALAALGRIATDEAVETIRQTLAKGPASLRVPAADACLAAAERLSAQKKLQEAAKLYDIVRKADVPPHLRTAATYHAILARGTGGAGLLVEQLKAKDPAMVAVALRAARKLPGPDVSKALAAELPKMKPHLQVLVIKVLVDRGAPIARGEIAALAASDTLEVRLESLKALGRIGDASAVAVLVKAAGAGGKEAAVARGSLRILKAPGADAAILAGMKNAASELRIELINVLADRRYAAATPVLLNQATAADAELTKAVFKALGVLGGAKDIPAMLKLLADVKGDSADQAETAIVRIAARIPDPAKRADAVAAALGSTKKAAERASLVRVLGRIGGQKAYDAVAAAARDADPGVTDAGIRALAAWPDGRAEAALLDLAKNTPDRTHRVLALRGYVRLLPLATDRQPREAARKYAEVLAIAGDADSRKLVLSGLAKVAHGDALKLAMEQLGKPGVRAEAGLAAVSIARLTMGTNRKAARAAMVKILAVSKNKAIVAEAQKIIQQIDKFADAITAWRVTGPYMKTGLKYNQLFDVAFEPEKPKGKGVKWRALPAGTDPKRPWILDLLKAIGGDQRVAYMLTWVHSDKAQPARLELGTDDSVKAWLNGRLVHANNIGRAAIPYTDKANITLKAGWNPLLLKITQNLGPWEFCARICARDGRRLDSIRIDAAHEGEWMLPAQAAKSVEPSKPVPAGKGEPIFDGKSLAGWRATMQPKTEAQKAAIRKMFRVEQGALVVDTLSVPVANRMSGYLATEKKYGDFVLRLRMQIERKWDGQGNSGIEVRNGLQFDLHPPNPRMLGWIWDHGPRTQWGYLSPIKQTQKESFAGGGAWKYGKAKNVPKGFKFHYADDPPGWNDVEITCRGLHFKFALNGVVMSDYDGTGHLDTKGRKGYQTTAPIMFQAHGKDGVIIRFKDIYIKELK